MPADITATVGGWLLTYLLHSTLLLGLAWALTRRSTVPAAVRDIIWKAALTGGLVTATIQTGLAYEPLGGALRLPGMAATASAKRTVIGAHAEWTGTLLGAANRAAEPEAAPSTPASATAPSPSAPTRLEETASGDEAPAPAGRSWLMVVLGAWGAIAFALAALYLVQRQRAMRRIGPRVPVTDPALARMLEGLRSAGGVRSPIRITAAAGLASPVALGRDEIVLPPAALTDLNPEQQRSMLAHELAHLARRDPSWLAAACLLERILFLQPLNRLARIRLQEAAEYLCDDWAVTRTGSGVSLATCLVKVAEWAQTPPHPVPMAGMAEHRSQLVTRIHRLIEGRTMPSAPRSLWFLAGAVALVGFTAVAAPGITTASGELQAQAQDTVRGDSAEPKEVSEQSVTRRMLRAMHLTQARAETDARHAMAADRRAMSEAAALAPRAPLPPRFPGPAMSPMGPRLSELRAELASVDGRSRRRDTTSIAVPALILALKDGDVEVRRAAVQSLSNLDDPRAIPAFIDALKDSDAEVRASAANGLGQFEDQRAIAPLVAALRDGDKGVRRSAMSALSSQAAEVPVELVVTALGDKDPEIRQAALGLVSRHADTEDERPVDSRLVQAVTGLVGDPNTDVRAEAIGMLGELRLTQAPASLVAAAKDRSAEVRERVASTLGQIHDPKTVPALRDLLGDANSDVREQAVSALGEIRDRSALEALVGALKSSDPVVRRSAAEALGQRSDEEQ